MEEKLAEIKERVRKDLEKAGLENGVGAWRPEHGRYIIEKFEKL